MGYATKCVCLVKPKTPTRDDGYHSHCSIDHHGDLARLQKFPFITGKGLGLDLPGYPINLSFRYNPNVFTSNFFWVCLYL